MSLVLIGPPGSGKSTVGPIVASDLGAGFVDADDAAIPYYEEAGWPLTRFAGLVEVVGYQRAHLAWEEALAYATPQLLSDYPDAVVALGAGHTHVTTPALRDVIRRALQGRTVVLLRPAHDLAASVAELRSRCVAGKGRDWIRDGVDWLDRWSSDGLDNHLANQTVYTMGRSPTQVASDVELAMTISSMTQAAFGRCPPPVTREMAGQDVPKGARMAGNSADIAWVGQQKSVQLGPADHGRVTAAVGVWTWPEPCAESGAR